MGIIEEMEEELVGDGMDVCFSLEGRKKKRMGISERED